MLSFLCSTPGEAVLILWWLRYWCFKNNKKEIDLEDFTLRISPMGWFRREDLKNIWDAQKVKREDMSGSDNLVDYASAGESVQFKN